MNGETNDGDAKTVIGRAVIAILKPLLRVLIRHEITVGDFNELARQAYVDVAWRDFALPGKRQTYARVAILTGLSRKEVVRLSKRRERAGTLDKPSPNRAQRVVDGWLRDEDFLTAKGRPRVLPIRGPSGSFRDLVARHSGDVTHGVVLEELEHAGIVTVDEGRARVRLETQGYVPRTDELGKISIMATCAADLLDSAAHNVVGAAPAPRFQRQVTQPDLSPAAAERFFADCEPLSADYLAELNRRLAALRDEDDATAPRCRVGIGVYAVYHTPADEDVARDHSGGEPS